MKRRRSSFKEFVELTRSSAEPIGLVPVYRQLLGDTLTPVSAFCKIQEGDWAFLFESVVGGERVGRYSFLGCRAVLAFEAYGIASDPRSASGLQRGRTREFEHPDPLTLLEEMLAAIVPRICRGCRASVAAPSATPATTPFATSSICRTRRRTIAACRT